MIPRTTTRPQFDAFDAELKLADKLHQAGVFNGATDQRIRIERCRRFIRDQGIAWEPSGRGQSYQEWFEATYGERL